MSKPIKYYFACISPWSYLGLDGLVEIASKHGRDIALMPTDVGRSWGETGAGRPLGERPEVLQSYRLVELPRWAAWRGVPINAEPKHFPAPYLLSSHVIIAAGHAGLDTIGVTRALMRGCWVNERNIGDPEDVIEILDGLGHDGAALVEASGSDVVAAELQSNTDAALADKAWSVPSFVVDGELFFGQDRLEMIDWRLSGADA
ncbi:MAG: 2-hydroxychromene-2-carboxylate isomerase [Alphaproteobacteria bacterium]|jgi:2-hydroxychromene-2-carboxylate isomerase|nr:2-hydroxychromene-2-carboxylate isomerase [Alphaproteobacteria bacterium]